MKLAPLAVLTLLGTTSLAAADTPFEIGARVGGYGFRREGDTSKTLGDPHQQWTECRMNGFGMFGGKQLRGPLFVEAGLDLYSSVDAGEPTDLPIDRTSGLLSTAIGARTQIGKHFRGYAQLGGGLELSRVSVPYGDERIRDSKAMPEGFFGIGLDIRVGSQTTLGSSFRAHVMGNFDYDPARLDMSQGWIAAPSKSEVFDASPDVATQVQFYLRREL
ncbi:MAG TPA: outer membrane beta-barrel protein [Kofleriaceae bacterium]|nr:outer membrane beta-barrel protein [Kofleriaceae bacterium]